MVAEGEAQYPEKRAGRSRPIADDAAPKADIAGVHAENTQLSS